MPIVDVNPSQARRFAEAAGKLADTDRLDAAMRVLWPRRSNWKHA